MQCVKLVMVLLWSLSLLTACSDGGSSSSPQPQVQRTWFWEHELTGANAQTAGEEHTVLLRLQPQATAGTVAGTAAAVKTVPFTYKRSGTYEYCIAADDPHFTGLTITSETTGAVVATVRQGACAQAVVKAGRHTMTVTYRPPASGEQERMAFIATPRTIQLTGRTAVAGVAKSAAGATDMTTVGKLALADPQGRVLTLSPQQTASDGKPNYFLTSVSKTNLDLNSDLFSFAGTGSGYSLVSAQGQLGAYYPSANSGNAQDLSYGDCPISVTQGSTAADLSVQSPLYTYSASNRGAPTSTTFSVSETGNYLFTLNVSMNQWSGVGLTASHVACAANKDNVKKYAQNLTILFRYYDDGTQLSTPLQQGEVALFEKPNFTGKAFVFIASQPTFRVNGGITAKSVKVGPNTRVGLYSGMNYSGPAFSTSTDVSDLGPTNVGSVNQLGSLQMSPDIQQIFLSSNACRSCDLSGLYYNYSSLKGYDFTNANLSNANFYNVNTYDSVFFTNARLTGAKFQFSDLAAAPSYQAIFTNCDFTGAVLDKGSFYNAIHNISNIDSFPYMMLKDCTFDGTSFKGAQLYGVSFAGKTTLFGTDMSSATIEGSAIRCSSGLDTCLSAGMDSGGKPLGLNLRNATINNGFYINKSNYAVRYGYFVLDLVNPSPSSGGDAQNCRYFDLTGATVNTDVTFSIYGDRSDLSNCSYRNINFTSTVSFYSSSQKPCTDMSDDTNLTGCVDFSGSTFGEGINTYYTDLRGALFENVTFNGGSFADALLDGASFKGARALSSQGKLNFTRASMNRVNLSNVSFNYAIFQGANLFNANLSNGSFYGALFSTDPSALQKQTRLDGAYLQNTNMASADLTSASMRNTSFHSKYQPSNGTCLPDANLKTTNCASAYKAIMVYTNLSNAYLAGLDLSGATLYGANFGNSVLAGANFTGAVIKSNQGTQPYTSFQGALLYGANFTNVTILKTNFGGAYFDDPATTQGYSNPSVLVSYLDTNYTSFPGSSYAGKTVCVRNQPTPVTQQKTSSYPVVDASSTCPDQSSGPCSGRQWLAPTPLDSTLYLLTYNYNGSPDPPPAPARCGPVVFW